jgi:hypothetical protein
MFGGQHNLHEELNIYWLFGDLVWRGCTELQRNQVVGFKYLDIEEDIEDTSRRTHIEFREQVGPFF